MPINKPIEVNLGKDAGKKLFHSLDEVAEWLKTEKEFWSWVSEYNPTTNDLKLLCNEFLNTHNALDARINKTRPHINNEPEYARQIEGLTNEFNNCYGTKNCIYSKTPRGKYIDELRQRDPEEAIYAIGYYANENRYFNQPKHVRAIVEIALLEKGIRGSSSEKAALKGIYQEHVNITTNSKKTLEDLKNTIHEITIQANTTIEEKSKEFLDTKTKAEKIFDNMIKAYEEKLSLKAPVKYWSDKKKHHRFLATIFGFLTLFLFGETGQGLAEAWIILNDISLKNAPAHWQLGTLVVSAFLALWVLRIFSKLFLTHVHLQIDSGEREVMTETYLSLLRDGSGIATDDRTIILQNLFRPATTGIVHDETMPPNMVELLNRLVTSKR